MKHLLIFAIRTYQRLSAYRPRTCRYWPTCSNYAIDAIQKYGALKGTGLAIWRILRCNPWSAGGLDPVR